MEGGCNPSSASSTPAFSSSSLNLDMASTCLASGIAPAAALSYPFGMTSIMNRMATPPWFDPPEHPGDASGGEMSLALPIRRTGPSKSSSRADRGGPNRSTGSAPAPLPLGGPGGGGGAGRRARPLEQLQLHPGPGLRERDGQRRQQDVLAHRVSPPAAAHPRQHRAAPGGQHRLAAIHLGVLVSVRHQRAQLAREARRRVPHERVPADEVALIEIDAKPQPALVRGVQL